MPSYKCGRQRGAACGSFNVNGSISLSQINLQEAALRRLRAQA